MAVVSFLEMPISAERLAEFEQDLHEMLDLARQQPGLRWVETYQMRDHPATQLIVSEWDSEDSMRAFLLLPRHIEIIRNYRRRYDGQTMTRRRYVQTHPKPRD
jgi:heme-degrading monooxygenase HmoA